MVHSVSVRIIMNISYSLFAGAGVGLVLSCTSKTSQIPEYPPKETQSVYESTSYTHSSIKEDLDTASTNIQSSPKHSKKNL